MTCNSRGLCCVTSHITIFFVKKNLFDKKFVWFWIYFRINNRCIEILSTRLNSVLWFVIGQIFCDFVCFNVWWKWKFVKMMNSILWTICILIFASDITKGNRFNRLEIKWMSFRWKIRNKTNCKNDGFWVFPDEQVSSFNGFNIHKPANIYVTLFYHILCVFAIWCTIIYLYIYIYKQSINCIHL